MTALASITLQEATASVSFSGIPQNYRDLFLVVGVPLAHNSGSGVSFNGDTDYSNNYSRVFMYGSGTSAISGANSGSASPAANRDLGALRPNGTLIAQIMDYSATNKHKTIITRAGGAGNDTWALASRWTSNSAINSFQFLPDSGALSAGITLNLYGRIA